MFNVSWTMFILMGMYDPFLAKCEWIIERLTLKSIVQALYLCYAHFDIYALSLIDSFNIMKFIYHQWFVFISSNRFYRFLPDKYFLGHTFHKCL